MGYKNRDQKREYDRKRYASRRSEELAARKTYYAANREKILARTTEWTKKRLATMKLMVEEAKSVPCADCKQRFPVCVMDFDHLDETTKNDTISNLSRNWKCSPRGLQIEMDKCEVVCANCHRIRTEFRRTAKKTVDQSIDLV